MNFLAEGKKLANGFKILFAIILIGFNLFYLIFKKSIASFEEQKSLCLMCLCLYMIVSPIDLSIVICNFLKFKYGEKKDIDK